MQRVVGLRSVFFPSGPRSIWKGISFEVALEPGERIIAVETIMPNHAVGAGTRCWIARTVGLPDAPGTSAEDPEPGYQAFGGDFAYRDEHVAFPDGGHH